MHRLPKDTHACLLRLLSAEGAEKCWALQEIEEVVPETSSLKLATLGLWTLPRDGPPCQMGFDPPGAP